MGEIKIKKVRSQTSPQGPEGQCYLAAGKQVSMRLWDLEADQPEKETRSSEYETVGYVISGKAELEIEGQTIALEPGDSWLVPAGASHRYRVLEHFSAVEATSPPANSGQN